MRIYTIGRTQLRIALVLTFCLLMSIIILSSVSRRTSVEDVFYIGLQMPSVIIDAGHGGVDGGAVSETGLIEAPLNLDISMQLQEMFSFLGVPSILTRTDENSLNYVEGNSVRQNKSADLNARLGISQSYPDCPFLSIHLNKYTQGQYKGAQVFYSPNSSHSQVLAAKLQERLRHGLDPQNDRRAKLSPDGVYLMKHITAPAVTIECGFLSNLEEAALLSTPDYRLKIALSICCGYIDFLIERGL